MADNAIEMGEPRCHIGGDLGAAFPTQNLNPAAPRTLARQVSLLQPAIEGKIGQAMKLNRETVVHVAEAGIIETIEAFVRFRPGFHGDTGIRDYLYHRLMAGLPNGGTHTRPDGGGTLVAQAEWYTVLKYRNTGDGPSRGRFDIGIVDPEDLNSAVARPLMTFECGRNKYAALLLADVDAPAEHEGPASADITKLAREINHAGLPLGYALEFFDENRWEAERLIDLVRSWISTSRCDGLCVVVLSCVSGQEPSLTFLPKSWDERLRRRFGPELNRIESLSCEGTEGLTGRGLKSGGRYTNRVSSGDFVCACSSEARLLIESVERRFHNRVKLIFGGRTMTVNLRPTGKLLKINKSPNSISELHPAVVQELALFLQESTRRSQYKIEKTDAFRTAVLAGIAKALSACGPSLVEVDVR